jgi:hypothetical protein
MLGIFNAKGLKKEVMNEIKKESKLLLK